ncbi:MAG: MBL fold metallo-hydrolase, partial [Planctomycetota bacterium]
NFATLYPRWGKKIHEEGYLICHGLLVELDKDLVLVDTGLGLLDIQKPKERLGRFFLWALQPKLDKEETAYFQVQSLGYDPKDVSHIILTHLDLDHAGGLSDFPHAKVHIMDREYERALNPAFWDKMRYSSNQWAHRVQWHSYQTSGEPWYGFKCVRKLDSLPPEILFVPLWGHSYGHAGVAIRGPEKWIFHCGDAYFHWSEVDYKIPEIPPRLKFFEWWIASNNQDRRENRERLFELKKKKVQEIQIFCSHCPVEFERIRKGDL